jgi:Lon protease-like protein
MEIPIFPLSSLLFPRGRMALQIFEQRYLDLVRSSLKEDSGFGITWIVEGAEISRPGLAMPELAQFGCYARIVDWDALPNGLLGITIEGGERFRLQQAQTRDSGLVMGEVHMEQLRAAEPIREEWDSMVDVLLSLEQHPHVQRLGIKVDHGDAWQVGYALAQLLPVDDDIKYALLALDDIEEFMAEMDELLNELGGFAA